MGDPLEREVVGKSLDPHSPEPSSPLAVCSLRSYGLECGRLTDGVSIRAAVGKPPPILW